jgi:Phytanoyl-CoA dioxygenase (PhyH)
MTKQPQQGTGILRPWNDLSNANRSGEFTSTCSEYWRWKANRLPRGFEAHAIGIDHSCRRARTNTSILNDGYQIIPEVLTSSEVEALQVSLRTLDVAPGHRQLMRRVPAVGALAVSAKILDLVAGALGVGAFPVRSIFFDKTPTANSLVPWHQDITIAVSEQVDLPGYGPWSKKAGVLHVQPPIEVLESMLTVRLHLDDCDEANGALCIIPGSHLYGRLNASQIAEMRCQRSEVICAARAGDALLMRPLLLHSSAEAVSPTHRRIVHLEYAACRGRSQSARECD